MSAREKNPSSGDAAAMVHLVCTKEGGSIAEAFDYYLGRGKRGVTLLAIDPSHTTKALNRTLFKTADVILVDGLSRVAAPYQEEIFSILEGCGSDVVIIEAQIQHVGTQLTAGRTTSSFRDFFESRCLYDTRI